MSTETNEAAGDAGTGTVLAEYAGFFAATDSEPPPARDLGNWGVIYDALRKAGVAIATGPNAQFQFVTTPTIAAFMSDVPYYADLLGNFASADLGPVFTRGVSSISDAYYDFINSLEFPNPTEDPKYRKLLVLMQNLVAQLDTINQDSVGGYLAFVANPQKRAAFPEIKNLTDWLASGPAGGKRFQQEIDALQAQLSNVNQQLIPFLTGSAASTAKAIANAATSNMVTVSIPSSGGQTKKVYAQSIAPPLGPLLRQWIDGDESNSVLVSIDANSKFSGNWFVQGGGSTGFSTGIFGFLSEGEATYNKQVEADAKFQLTLSVQANSTFTITREGGWFDGTLLAQNPTGPWVSRTADTYFGSRGSLKLVPSQILVSYGTNVTLTLSESTMTMVKQQAEVSAGLLIGPFFLGAETLGTSTTVSNADGSQTLTTKSTDNNAYVTGYLSQSFYNGK